MAAGGAGVEGRASSRGAESRVGLDESWRTQSTIRTHRWFCAILVSMEFSRFIPSLTRETSAVLLPAIGGSLSPERQSVSIQHPNSGREWQSVKLVIANLHIVVVMTIRRIIKPVRLWAPGPQIAALAEPAKPQFNPGRFTYQTLSLYCTIYCTLLCNSNTILVPY